jgi:hypothetical protein
MQDTYNAYQEWPHPEDTDLPQHSARHQRGQENMGNKMINFKIDTTNNENENPKGCRLGTVSGKTICHWGFPPGSRVHQPHTCPNRFFKEQTSTMCLGELAPTNPSRWFSAISIRAV